MLKLCAISFKKKVKVVHDKHAIPAAVQEVDRFNEIRDLVDCLIRFCFPDSPEAVPDEEAPIFTLDDLFFAIRFRGDQADRRGS